MADRDRKSTDLGPFYEQLGQVHCFGAFAYLGTHLKVYQADTIRCRDECRRALESFQGEEGVLDDFQFWTRGLVRAFFSQVEGTAFLMRQAAVWSAGRAEVQLSNRKQLELQERRINSEGVEVDAYNSVEDNVKLAFQHFPRVFGLSDWQSPAGRDERWSDFCYAVQVRHGLMHPRRLGDFIVPVADFPRLERALAWFADAMSELLELVEARVMTTAQKARIPPRVARRLAAALVEAGAVDVGTKEGLLAKARAEEALAKVLPQLARHIPNCKG